MTMKKASCVLSAISYIAFIHTEYRLNLLIEVENPQKRNAIFVKSEKDEFEGQKDSCSNPRSMWPNCSAR